MAEPFLGEIAVFAGTFAPRNWALCNGQLMNIAQNTALFSLLGTTYGGDGQTTFGLPDLRGRVAMSSGTGPGLTARTLGEKAGTENLTVLLSQIPVHTHPIMGSTAAGTSSAPQGNVASKAAVPASPATVLDAYYTAAGANLGTLAPISMQPAGTGTPHSNVMPYVVLNYIIATAGIFPSRS